MTTRELKRVIRDKYAWPGGYELFGLTSDGGILCVDCMRKEWRQIVWSIKNNVSDGWKVVGVDSDAQLEPREFIEGNLDEYSLSNCDGCGKILNP